MESDHAQDEVFYGQSPDTGATLDDLREAVTTLEELERTARRVFGGAHPDQHVVEERTAPSAPAKRPGGRVITPIGQP